MSVRWVSMWLKHSKICTRMSPPTPTPHPMASGCGCSVGRPGDERRRRCERASKALKKLEANTSLRQYEWAAEHCSAPFRAPELWDCPSHANIDARTDIWALGYTKLNNVFAMYSYVYIHIVVHMNTDSGGSLQLAIMNVQIRWPSTANPPFPESFHPFITWMLQPQPSIRPFIDDDSLKGEKNGAFKGEKYRHALAPLSEVKQICVRVNRWSRGTMSVMRGRGLVPGLLPRFLLQSSLAGLALGVLAPDFRVGSSNVVDCARYTQLMCVRRPLAFDNMQVHRR
ncbi:hypothetical protein KSP40_PGU022311 [Platanthera guangdongensis]|uniref:non-specific serine/threonine protein kinase n=1 Tax=Platanthera guangdongensis TaxID=2320717 RepID=A0ABR2N0Q5_9ASPA